MKPAKGFFRVESSHGILLATSETGQVVSRERYDPKDEESAFIDRIVRFDVVEWNVAYPSQGIERASLDILDLGYTYRCLDGSLEYEPPASDWRGNTATGSTR